MSKNVSFNPSTTGGLFGAKTDTSSKGGLFGAKPTGAFFGSSNTSQTTGGLFGGAAETKQQSKPLGLFGAKTNTPAKTGLFGGTTTAAGATTGTTTGATPAGTASTGLFGAKPAGTTSTGLFGAKTETPSTGLFGAKPAGTTSTGLFGGTQAAPSSGLFASKPSTGLFGTQPASTGLFTSSQTGTSLLGNPQMVSPYISGDQSAKNAQEIEVVMQNYASQIDPTSTHNSFMYWMYNKYAKNVNPQFKEQIKKLIPIKDIASVPENNKLSGEATGTKQLEVFIDQKKFAKAKRENTDPDQFYVKQINTYEELIERLYNFKQASKQIKEFMAKVKEQMTSIKDNSDTKLRQGMRTLKENMKVLRSRILEVQTKLNLATGNTAYSQEERERINNLFEETTGSQKVCGKVEEVKGKLEELLEKKSTYPRAVPSETFNALSNEDKRRVISVLKEQTKGINILMKTVNKNAHKLEIIEKITDEIKNERAREAEYNARYMY